jgi:hypothetical protein
MSLVALDVAPLSSKQLALLFLLTTHLSSLGSVAPSATALQLDMFLVQMQFVNLQMFLITYV